MFPAFWTSPIFLVTGIIGIRASRATTTPRNQVRRGAFIAFLTLSVFSACLAAAIFITGVVFMILGDLILRPCYDETIRDCRTPEFHQMRTLYYALRGLSLHIYFTLIVLFIVTSAFSCCNLCPRNGDGKTSSTVIYKVPANQQHLHGQEGKVVVATAPEDVEFIQNKSIA